MVNSQPGNCVLERPPRFGCVVPTILLGPRTKPFHELQAQSHLFNTSNVSSAVAHVMEMRAKECGPKTCVLDIFARVRVFVSGVLICLLFVNP